MHRTHDGIVLIAKQSGITSFSSLWQIKNALGTKKIGHTGTLDTFADGLLVALSGRLTRLAPFVTGCDKEYLASILFGTETDTLDPDGLVLREAPLPRYSEIQAVLPSFHGTIMQKPPAYSALHVDGQRASDLVRKGEAVDIPAREITIHSIEITRCYASGGDVLAPDSPISRLDLRIACSKGTYIRSIARDIALQTGSAAHLGNLRRTRIGPFSLEDAAGFSMLSPFGTTEPAQYGVGEKPPQVPSAEILAKVQDYTRGVALIVGLPPVELDESMLVSFRNGKHPEYSWFSKESQVLMRKQEGNLAGSAQGQSSQRRFSVFCGEMFMGVISASASRPVYDFVIGDQT
jgi:tRNA pseudouridine55 synthase